MVKFEVKPFATLSGTDKDDIKTGVEARFKHNDMVLKVRTDDSALRGGGACDGLVLSAKKAGAFEFVYDVGTHGTALTFHSSAMVGDKDVGLKYMGKDSVLEGTVSLDDKNTATIGWNIGGKPDYKQMNLKWHYRHDDKWAVEPSYDFGKEAFAAKVIHTLDDENRITAKYDASANTGNLMWSNTSIGGPGLLRVSAESSLSDDGLKSMPVFRAEKVFDIEL